MIQNIVQILRATVCPDQCNWVMKIPMMEFAINSSVNKATGFTPFELTYGYLPHMTTSIPLLSNFAGVQEFTQQALDNIQSAHNMIIMSHIKQSIQANKHRSPYTPLEVGKYVYLSTKDLNLPKGRTKKLILLYIRPYEILEAFKDSSTYTIKLPPELEKWGIFPKFHMLQLAPHEPNDSLLFLGRAAQTFYDFGENTEKEFQVHEILDHMWNSDKSIWFRIKWALGNLTWEPSTNVDELSALDDYLMLHGVDNIEELPHKHNEAPDTHVKGNYWAKLRSHKIKKN